MGWQWSLGLVVVLGLACSVEDDGAPSGDDSCTGAACCEGGCPSSNPETGADDGDDNPGDECDGGCDANDANDANDADADADSADDDSSDDGVSESDSADDGPVGATGTCRLACDATADCCSGAGDCAFACDAGVCVPIPCTPGSCEPQFQYNFECGELDGRSVCLPVCDENCGQPNSGEGCFGVADDGGGYCLEPCNSPFIGGCGGGQVCDEVTGRCYCSADAECGDGFLCDPI